MSLRFQKKDAVDEEVRDQRNFDVRSSIVVYGFALVLFSVVVGLFDWFSGKSLKSYGEEIGEILALLVLLSIANWLVAPFYYEFRLRTKEIDGKVSAIEEAVNASKEAHAELLERLTAIEEKLTEVQDARRI